MTLTKTDSPADELALFPTEDEEVTGFEDTELVAEADAVDQVAEGDKADVSEDFETNLEEADDTEQPAVTAFQDAVREAQQAAEKRLTTIVEQARQAAAEQHAAELASAKQQYEAEVLQLRDDYSAEAQAAIDAARQELTEQHAVELARLRDELEQQHADDLNRVRTVAIESFNTLADDVLEQV